MPPTDTATKATDAGHYLPRAELSHILFAYAEAGRAADALGRALLLIAGGVWDKHRFAGLDRDDFVQSCALHLFTLVRRGKVDPTQNPFSYLTTCGERLGFRLRGRAAARARREAEFRTRVADAALRLFGRRARDEDDCYGKSRHAELPDEPVGEWPR